MAKRNYKKNREKARSAYETYSYWYDKYTKGYKQGWFREKYTKEEFDRAYELARKAKVANPAKAVAQSQEYVDRQFEKKYRELYGKHLGDIRDKGAREDLFVNYINERHEQGIEFEDAKNEFEEYFY